MNTNIDPEVQAFFRSIYHMTIESEPELLWLGKANIQDALRFFRQESKSLETRMQKNEALLKVIASIRNKSIERPERSFASAFWGHAVQDQGADIMPDLDIAYFVQSNATTLNICGWCKYGQSAVMTQIYNCVLQPKCNFLLMADIPDDGRAIKDEKELYEQMLLSHQEQGEKLLQIEKLEALYPGLNVSRFHMSPPQVTQRNFMTPCFLWFADDQLLKCIEQLIAAKNRELANDKNSTDERIRYLVTCRNRAERKPAFSRNRQIDWFTPGDRVMVYIGDILLREKPDTYWSVGTVCEIQKSEDREPIVVRLDEDLFSLPTDVMTMSNASPYILHEWEYHYLRTNPEWFEQWIMVERTSHPTLDSDFLSHLMR